MLPKQTIKRHSSGTKNAVGAKTGGQFKAQERAAEKADVGLRLASSLPYPCNKRKVTIRVHASQTSTRPIKTVPSVSVNKDLGTGRWYAQTPYASATNFQERINGGLIGIPEEIAGWTAKVSADLANRGDLNFANQDHVKQAAAGISMAGAMLQLSGAWSNPSPSLKRNTPYASSAITHMRSKLRHAKTMHQIPENYYAYSAQQNGAAANMIKHILAAMRVSGTDGVLPQDNTPQDYKMYQCSEDVMIRTIASSHALQLFMSALTNNERETARHMFVMIEQTDLRTDLNNSPIHYMPDSIFNGLAMQALTGTAQFPAAGHDGQAFKRFLDTSETEHTSHIFEPSMKAVAEYGTHAKEWFDICSDLRETYHQPVELFSLIDESGVTAEETLIGDLVMGRHPASGKQNVRYNTKWVFEADSAHKAHFGRQGTVFQYHPEINKIPLALYTMAVLEPKDDARIRAENFINANNYEPLATSLLASAVEHYNNLTDQIWAAHSASVASNGLSLWGDDHYEHVPTVYKNLLVDACKAWQAYEPDMQYVKTDGNRRLDPDRILTAAKNLW